MADHMRCHRCGYCCKRYLVVIVDDPALGVVEDNLKVHDGQGQACPHLVGDQPGEYVCALHDQPYYEETPCFAHGDESSLEACALGAHILQRWKEGVDVAGLPR